jgi:hypothetical protein
MSRNRIAAEGYTKPRPEYDPAFLVQAGTVKERVKSSIFRRRRERIFLASRAIYLEPGRGYFGHQYQPFRRLSK